MNKLLSLLVLLLFTGCSIFNADSETESFEAKIGSKSFKANALAYQSDSESVLSIIGRKGEWEGSTNLTFSIIDFDGTTGEYLVSNPSYYTVSGGDALINYAASNDTVSSVTITKYDSTTDEIKGNFSFMIEVKRPFKDYEIGEKVTIKGNFEATVEKPKITAF